MYEMHWTGLSRPSLEREMNLQLFRHEILRYGAGTPNQHRQTNVCTVGWELVLHNGKFLGVTARDSRRPVTAAFRTQNCLATTATRCFPTSPLLVQGRRRFVVAWEDPKISASTTTDGVYLVDARGPIKLPLHPARYTTSTGAVRGSFEYTKLARLHGGSTVT